jgi:hypothetical protein
MAHWWQAGDSAWREEAEEATRFVLEAHKGVPRIDWPLARARLPDVAHLIGAALPAGCDHARIFPQGFAFCPECGAPVRQIRSAPHASWWGATSAPLPHDAAPLPRHVPSGLAQTALPLAAALETRPPEPAVGEPDLSMDVPPNAVCAFVAADFGYAAQRLLAIAYTRNVVQYRDTPGERWHVFAPDDGSADLRFTRSAWALLPPAPEAERGDAGIVPAQEGLVRLVVNPLAESWRTETILSATLAASPGAVGRRVAVPFVAADGVRLWTAAAGGADPDVLAIEGEQVPTQGWSRPFAYDGRLHWLHDEGQLLWRPGAAPRWQPWPFPW